MADILSYTDTHTYLCGALVNTHRHTETGTNINTHTHFFLEPLQEGSDPKLFS